jgi:predicted aspartyl protease
MSPKRGYAFLWSVKNMGVIRQKVKIEGKEVNAIVDSAASRSTIPKNLADELGLKAMKIEKVPTPPYGKIEKIPLTLAELEIGKCKTNEAFWILGEGTNPLLGQTVLQRFDAKIDMKNEKLIINQCMPMI